MPQLFTYLVVTFFGPLTWSLWNFRHNSWKKYRTLHLKKSLEEYESPSKLPSTLHSMALVTRTRHPFWMSLIISFSLMRKQDTQVRCPSSQTAALWTSLWPGAKSMACPDPMLSFPSLWPCFIFLHFLSLPPTFWEDTLLQELSFTYWKLFVLF